jgi:hypothetical protein
MFGWEAFIVNRMNEPSPVTITMWGNYIPSLGTGMIYAKFRNDSTSTIDGRIFFVITEDSVFYEAPSGDDWHNHVPRDYLPDQNGELVTILPGDSVIISRNFTIQSGWDDDMCDIAAWVQNDIMQADSTKGIWQGGIKKVTDLIVGIEENGFEAASYQYVSPMPNPCVNKTSFAFRLPKGTEYQIDLYDVSGRQVRRLRGISSGNQESVK